MRCVLGLRNLTHRFLSLSIILSDLFHSSNRSSLVYFLSSFIFKEYSGVSRETLFVWNSLEAEVCRGFQQPSQNRSTVFSARWNVLKYWSVVFTRGWVRVREIDRDRISLRISEILFWTCIDTQARFTPQRFSRRCHLSSWSEPNEKTTHSGKTPAVFLQWERASRLVE